MDIFDAIRKNDIRSVKTMINQEPSVIHHINDNHKTSLHIACHYKRTEIAHLLINAGADVGAKDTYGWTPLHYACRYGLKDLAQLLIDAGADVHAQTNRRFTPLLFACYDFHTEIAQLLIKAGSDIGAKAEGGWTSLHVACYHNLKEIAQLFIETDVNVDWLVANKDGRTPIDLAIAKKSSDVLIFLESISNQLPTPEKKKLRAWRFRQELIKTS